MHDGIPNGKIVIGIPSSIAIIAMMACGGKTEKRQQDEFCQAAFNVQAIPLDKPSYSDTFSIVVFINTVDAFGYC